MSTKDLAKDLAGSVREFTEKMRAQIATGDVQGANSSLDQLSAVADVADAEKVAEPASAPATSVPATASSTSKATPPPPPASEESPKEEEKESPPAAPVSKGADMNDPLDPAVILKAAASSVTPVEPAPLNGDAAISALFGQPAAVGSLSKSVDPGIMATPPPPPTSPMLVYSPKADSSYVDEMAPALYKALTRGGNYALDEAVALFKSGNSGRYDFRMFDMTLHKVYRTLLDAGGFNEGNETMFHKMAITSREAGELGARDFVGALQKGVISTTAPGYYLHQMVKIMLPVLTPLLNRFATQKPRTGGKQAEWRANLGFANLDETQGMTAPEAGVTVGSTTGIGQNINENPVLFQTPYSRHPVNDAVTVEAQYAMLGYDDAFQYAMVRALTAYMRIAEMATLWNNKQTIGAPASVTVTAVGSGSIANTNDKIAITALTGIGWRMQALATGGQGGASSVAGESLATLSSATDLSSAASFTVSWPIVKGAVAYNMYYVPAGVPGAAIYKGTYTRNLVSITAKPTGAVNLYPTIDGTPNTYGYEGVVPWSELTTIYGNALTKKTVTDQAGTALTLAGPNRIKEIDTILANLLTDWQLAPSLIIGSPNMIRHVNNMIQSGGAAQPYVVHLGTAEQGSIVGGLWAGAYTNNYSLGLQNVPKLIDLMAHPYLADGTLLIATETIPYPMAREARGWLIEQQIPLTYWPLASLTAAWPFMLNQFSKN